MRPYQKQKTELDWLQWIAPMVYAQLIPGATAIRPVFPRPLALPGLAIRAIYAILAVGMTRLRQGGLVSDCKPRCLNLDNQGQTP